MKENVMEHMVWRVLVVAVVGWAVGAGSGKTIYVDDDANSPGDGRSWATAYKYLQDGLADANISPKPVEIRVAQGMYRPDEGAGQVEGDVRASFVLLNEVVLRGGFAGVTGVDPNARDVAGFETILSGDLAGDDVDVADPPDLLYAPGRADNSCHVAVASRTDNTAALEGFTIEGGIADCWYADDWGGGIYCDGGSPMLADCTFRANAAFIVGGGMWCKDGEPTLVRCVFRANGAGYGAALALRGGKARLEDCVFVGHRTEWEGAGLTIGGAEVVVVRCVFIDNETVLGAGGAVEISSGVSQFQGCLFEGNDTGQDGGAGGAIYMSSRGTGVERGSTVLDGCRFVGNGSGTYGGAIGCFEHDLVISHCTLQRNNAAILGGAICCKDADVAIRHSLFSQNTAGLQAGGIISSASAVTISNTTLSANSAPYGNGIVTGPVTGSHGPSKLGIENSILWDGADEIRFYDLSVMQTEIRYSDVCGGWVGAGNIDADPLFADAPASDLHLKSQGGRWLADEGRWTTDDLTSPCIDAGDPLSPIDVEPFPNGGRVNMGAYGGTAEASKSYFGRPVCETIVAGDINGDCKVDFQDCAIMLSHWLSPAGG